MSLSHPAVVQGSSIPREAYISGFEGHAQSFNLSCESRSAVDWAAFWGFRIRERKFLLGLPRSDNPDVGFVGDPNGAWGDIPPASYGVHAKPVAALLREFGLNAEAQTGMTWDDLRREIAAGRPVIAWVIGQVWPGTPQKYTASNGKVSTVARFEHTVIVVGYNQNSVQIVDAYTGQKQTHPRRAFLASWAVLGNMAITGGGARTQPAGSTQEQPAPVEAHLLPVHVFMPVMYRGPARNKAATNRRANHLPIRLSVEIFYWVWRSDLVSIGLS